MLGFLSSLGEQVVDAEEESFLLFTRDIPSANLGFVDARASVVDVTLHGQELAIHQSPTLLSSRREGGTTGAVLWKITPRFAEWIAAPKNPFFAASILTPSATVVELGCGISGLVALALAPRVGHFIATDQEYVRKLFKQNIDENVHQQQQQQPKKRKPKVGNSSSSSSSSDNITFTPLDWEVDNPSTLKQTISSTNTTTTGDQPDPGFDLLISCDCIYNEALVPAFVRTCADICRLRPTYQPNTIPDEDDDQSGSAERPTVCVIAQQQRSPDVFETWLRETLRVFDVWRLSDHVLGEVLKDGTGYIVHALALKASSH
ncbi:hypothetical protein PISL3812_08473 [Talaromyces islandicus]|uniref:Diaminohydroxyphosphoribosylamino-pyrimidine deaminase n=1 Tax=Talaromyces islandicus TaxID=28573 RepID=A0A0U1M774_TALIS|nr:hypothetical protein PISL3812_08473 [Talaromyces islandicus]